MIIVEAEEARKRLTPEVCIPLMREAFIALEKGEAIQPLRSINHLPQGNTFGFMPDPPYILVFGYSSGSRSCKRASTFSFGVAQLTQMRVAVC